MIFNELIKAVSPRGELFAVNMVANTKTGGTWTQQQYTNWLASAGFSQVTMYSIGDRQIITACR